MSFASIILLLVTLQRLGELVLSRHNTRRLLARGAIEVDAGHYPLIVSVHAAWLIALWIWGRDQDVVLPALAGFIVLQGLRLWILATLWPRRLNQCSSQRYSSFNKTVFSCAPLRHSALAVKTWMEGLLNTARSHTGVGF